LYDKENLLKINLESLSIEEVNTVLEMVFDEGFENLNKLAAFIYRRTLGNPLYIKQMLNLLIDNDSIYYNTEINRWCLDPGKAIEVNIPDTVADIINSRIDSLSHEARQLLEIASCIGSRFSLELMRKLIKNEITSLEEKIDELCRTGLIIRVFEQPASGKKDEFEFFHDRIYQNVYDHIAPDRREQLHFDIAMELLDYPDKIFVEENLLSITGHLLECKDVIKREGVEDRLIVDIYLAGLKAKQSAAFEHALKLFSLSEELLGNCCWEKDYDMTLKIKLELAECQFICGHQEEAHSYFLELQEHAASEEDLAEIKKRNMILYSYTGHHDRVIKLGFQALKHLGFKIDTQALPLQIAKEIICGSILFRNSRLESIKNAPIITNKRLMNALEILTIMAASANLTDEKLFTLIVLKIGNLSAKYGNSLFSPLGYAAYSLVLGPVLGNFSKAAKLMEISLNLAELFDEDQFRTPTYFCIGTFVAHWIFPASVSLDFLQKAFDCGIRAGDYLYCAYSLIMMTEMKYLSGEPLEELHRFIIFYEKYTQKFKNDLLKRSFAMFKDHICMLSKPSFSSKDMILQDIDIEVLNTNEAMFYYLLKIKRLYLSGKIEEAFNLANKKIKHLESVMGSVTQVDFVFYFLLVSLEKLKKFEGKSCKGIKNSCLRYIKELKKWAQMSPKNHYGKYLLIKALLASLNNQQQDAARLYDEAIEHAKENNNLFLEALGNYLAAGYFGSNRKISRVYAQDAFNLFLKWGAPNVAERIRCFYKIYNNYDGREVSCRLDEDNPPEKDGREIKGNFEIRARYHQKELETLNLEDAHKYFLDIICKEIGADHCAILLEEGDTLKLEYIRKGNQAVEKFPVGIDIEQYDDLPKKVIRYAGRTYDEVIIDSKPVEGPFASDDYIKKRSAVSIICLPLKYNEIFIGLIYLENKNDKWFDASIVDYIRRQSFYLVAKQALERGTSDNGKTYINETLKEQLTKRELEVLYYMAKGLSNKEIGEKLCISASTVKTHAINLYGKLEVNSRIQAVTKAKALKLI